MFSRTAKKVSSAQHAQAVSSNYSMRDLINDVMYMQALDINLNPLWYGVIAEIGAGQEVARWFFRVGAAGGSLIFCIKLQTANCMQACASCPNLLAMLGFSLQVMPSACTQMH